jgi:ATP-binding cassette, subfamily B, bacterial
MKILREHYLAEPMTIPYIHLIKTVWQNGKPWHRSIVGYYLAYIVAQSFLSLSPYAFGRTIDLLQHFSHF